MRTSERTGMKIIEPEELLTVKQKLTLLVDNRPWENEADYDEWVDEGTGYVCSIKRHPELFHLCGYVSVPNTPPFAIAGYNDDPFSNIEVHGGLTYSNVEDDRKKFGFDCGHAGDMSPGMMVFGSYYIIHEAYRDWAYVKTEVLSLAHQLKQLEDWYAKDEEK